LKSRASRVALVTYGCAKNLVDSEVMLGYLSRAGYEISPQPEKADVIIVNTCGFIQPARDEAIEGIENALALKRGRPERTIAVTGCFVERFRPDLERKFPGVDVWLGVKDFDHIVEALEKKSFRPGSKTYLLDEKTPRRLSTPSTWAYLKISEGCSHACAFCSIPLIKGPYRSRSIPSVVAEAEALAESGIKEINLISQDTTYFGRDRRREGELISLLRGLIDIRGIRWIRLLYGYPEEITPGLLEILKEKKICSYLDIPFQHSDRRILKSMKRGLSGRQALRVLETIRKKLPDAAIRTSLIVGFPGEGRSEFHALKKFVERAAFDHLGVFTYSPEKGTSASALGDPIPEREKTCRRDEIMALQAEIARSVLRKHVGRQLDVLIDPSCPAKKNEIVGRARFQAPEVDGVVLIERRGAMKQSVRPLEKVEIISTGVYDLRGILVQ
jgi:ribosomal protein S12 methylthiotransferase